MTSMTNPMLAAQAGSVGIGMTTSPMAAGFAAPGGAEMMPAVASGIATQFWAELAAYPPGSARSLWLQVAGTWKRYDNAPPHWEDAVQNAFANGQTVRVWHDGSKIVGLVVAS